MSEGFFKRTARIYVDWMDSQNFVRHSIALFWLPVFIPIILVLKYNHIFEFAEALDKLSGGGK